MSRDNGQTHLTQSFADFMAFHSHAGRSQDSLSEGKNRI